MTSSTSMLAQVHATSSVASSPLGGAAAAAAGGSGCTVTTSSGPSRGGDVARVVGDALAPDASRAAGSAVRHQEASTGTSNSGGVTSLSTTSSHSPCMTAGCGRASRPTA